MQIRGVLPDYHGWFDRWAYGAFLLLGGDESHFSSLMRSK